MIYKFFTEKFLFVCPFRSLFTTNLGVYILNVNCSDLNTSSSYSLLLIGPYF